MRLSAKYIVYTTHRINLHTGTKWDEITPIGLHHTPDSELVASEVSIYGTVRRNVKECSGELDVKVEHCADSSLAQLKLYKMN